MKIPNLIVGAGLSGAVLARKLADAGRFVVVIDARRHIAGNCHDDYQDGICVHQYGTHIFHTDNKEVWDFLSRFCKWHPYFHKVRAMVDGQLVPVPFNLNALSMVFPAVMAARMEQKLLDEFGFNKKVPILELRKKTDKDLLTLAQYVYEKIFLEYTVKQWGQAPDEIDPSVSARVPVCISRDDRYFQDKYQGIPLGGYTAMVQKMLDSPNIEIRLNTPFDRSMDYENLYWTGSIDEFFDYQYGELPYRSERFDFITLEYPQFQEVAVVNYPCNYDFTRIGEYKHFLNDPSPRTVISYEYPEPFVRGKNERYYPIQNVANFELYKRYLALEKRPNVHFLGRLGDYKYYDMDKAAARSLELYKGLA